MAKKQVTIPIFIPHFGCPHTCAFCDQWTASSAEQVPDGFHIDKTVAQYLSGIKPGVNRIELAFFGGSFTGIPVEQQEAYLEKASYYYKQKKIQGIRLSTRPDYIDAERLALLKRYGVTTVEVGVQSFDDEVLLAANRGHSSSQAARALALLRQYEFDFVIQLMPGLPGADYASDMLSARQAVQFSPGAVRVYPTVVLKNTQLEKLYTDGYYQPLQIEQAVEFCKELTVVFQEKEIPIIRMGLHPLAVNELQNIVAGPYHPAFGFLVKSRLKRDILEGKVAEYLSKKNVKQVTIKIPNKEQEEYVGYKKENVDWLRERFGLEKVVIVPGRRQFELPPSRNEIVID